MRRGSRQLKSILNYIDGQFVRGKREFADVNPSGRQRDRAGRGGGSGTG